MKFLKTPENLSGDRIYGVNGNPLLLIRGNWVVNGCWEVVFDNPEQTICRSKAYPSLVFEYICHVDYEYINYNEVLYEAQKESIKQ